MQPADSALHQVNIVLKGKVTIVLDLVMQILPLIHV